MSSSIVNYRDCSPSNVIFNDYHYNNMIMLLYDINMTWFDINVRKQKWRKIILPMYKARWCDCGAQRISLSRGWRVSRQNANTYRQFIPKPRWNDSNQRFHDDIRLYYSGFVTKNPIVTGSLSENGVPLRLPESSRLWEWITANNTLSSAIIISQWYRAFVIKSLE